MKGMNIQPINLLVCLTHHQAANCAVFSLCYQIYPILTLFYHFLHISSITMKKSSYSVEQLLTKG
jgi:hypothetical protein